MRKGDGRTPEGRNRISDRSPRRAYHLSLRIDCPSARDRTAGCIAVTEAETEEIRQTVADGTPIEIVP